MHSGASRLTNYFYKLQRSMIELIPLSPSSTIAVRRCPKMDKFHFKYIFKHRRQDAKNTANLLNKLIFNYKNQPWHNGCKVAKEHHTARTHQQTIAAEHQNYLITTGVNHG
jgi:hypothetical protein